VAFYFHIETEGPRRRWKGERENKRMKYIYDKMTVKHRWRQKSPEG